MGSATVRRRLDGSQRERTGAGFGPSFIFIYLFGFNIFIMKNFIMAITKSGSDMLNHVIPIAQIEVKLEAVF